MVHDADLEKKKWCGWIPVHRCVVEMSDRSGTGGWNGMNEGSHVLGNSCATVAHIFRALIWKAINRNMSLENKEW